MPNPERWKPAHAHIVLKGIHTYSVEVLHVQHLCVKPDDDGKLRISAQFVIGATKAYQVYAHAMRGDPAAIYLGVVFRCDPDKNEWCCVFATGKFWGSFATTRRGAIEKLMEDFFVS